MLQLVLFNVTNGLIIGAFYVLIALAQQALVSADDAAGEECGHVQLLPDGEILAHDNGDLGVKHLSLSCLAPKPRRAGSTAHSAPALSPISRDLAVRPALWPLIMPLDEPSRPNHCSCGVGRAIG
jgi:hypothetical protein